MQAQQRAARLDGSWLGAKGLVDGRPHSCAGLYSIAGNTSLLFVSPTPAPACCQGSGPERHTHAGDARVHAYDSIMRLPQGAGHAGVISSLYGCEQLKQAARPLSKTRPSQMLEDGHSATQNCSHSCSIIAGPGSTTACMYAVHHKPSG